MNSDPILCFPTQQEAPLERHKQMLHHLWKTGHHVSKSHAVWRYQTKPGTIPTPSRVLDTWSASSTTPGTQKRPLPTPEVFQWVGEEWSFPYSVFSGLQTAVPHLFIWQCWNCFSQSGHALLNSYPGFVKFVSKFRSVFEKGSNPELQVINSFF